MPNLVFYHSGTCAADGCGERIVLRVEDSDVLITDTGRKVPREVFVGARTPKRLLTDVAGQKVHQHGVVIEKKLSSGRVVTVEEVIQKGGEDEKVIDRGAGRGSVGRAGPG